MDWILANKEWLFSGAGIAFITLLAWLFPSKPKKQNSSDSQHIQNVNAGRDVLINQYFNKDSALAKQAHLTFISLKQMPGRLQEAVNSGSREYTFDEARKEIENLFAISQAENQKDMNDKLILFQDRFNSQLIHLLSSTAFIWICMYGMLEILTKNLDQRQRNAVHLTLLC